MPKPGFENLLDSKTPSHSFKDCESCDCDCIDCDYNCQECDSCDCDVDK